MNLDTTLLNYFRIYLEALLCFYCIYLFWLSELFPKSANIIFRIAILSSYCKNAGNLEKNRGLANHKANAKQLLFDILTLQTSTG